jgi:raffinose/stachyose/melibiose transport system permease protein
MKSQTRALPWRRQTVGKYVIALVLAAYSSIVVLLILNNFFASLKSKSELINNILGFPQQITFTNYLRVFIDDQFYRYFLNSGILLVGGVLLGIFIAALTAYGIAKYRFKGKTFVLTFFLIGLMFPIQLGILPIFIILRTLHLTNTFPGMILVYMANMSFFVFVFAKFFETLPNSLYESGKIDGAGEFRIFAQIMMPLAQPVIATMALIKAVNIWNDFYMPLVILTRSEVRTLTLAIYNYLSDFFANWHLVFTAVTVALVPILIIFFLFQRQLIEGITAGALKQ